MELNMTLQQALAKASPSLRKKIEASVELLRKGEALALKYSPNGYMLGMSGGKDSQVLYHMAQLAEVKIEPYMSLTSVDPPEVVQFMRHNYPEVKLLPPPISMYKLIVKKCMLPIRQARYCCAVLKESKGAGRVVLTGIRHQESVRRAKRNAVEITNRKFSGDIEQFKDYQEEQIVAKLKKKYKNLNVDQFSTKQQQSVRCIGGKDSIIFNPIIEWLDCEVWELLNDVLQVPHCELYDQGSARLGCLFCPMAKKSEKIETRKRYPKVERAYKNAIKELLMLRPQTYDALDHYVTDVDDKVNHVWEWWLRNASMAEYISDTFIQQKLNFDE